MSCHKMKSMANAASFDKWLQQWGFDAVFPLDVDSGSRLSNRKQLDQVGACRAASRSTGTIESPGSRESLRGTPS